MTPPMTTAAEAAALCAFILDRLDEIEAIALAAATRNGAEDWCWYDNETDAALVPDPLTEETLCVGVEGGFRVSLRSIADFPSEHVGSLPVFALPVAEDVPATTALHIVTHDPAYVLADVAAKRQILNLIGSPGPMVLRLLALPFANHPHFEEQWLP